MKLGGWKTESVAKHYVHTSGLPLVDKGGAAQKEETWPELRGRYIVASYHCRLSSENILRRVQCAGKG